MDKLSLMSTAFFQPAAYLLELFRAEFGRLMTLCFIY